MWTYADFEEQQTPAGKAERLRLHITEVGNRITASVGSGGKNRDASTLMEYRRMLGERLAELEKITGTAGRGARGVRVRFD